MSATTLYRLADSTYVEPLVAGWWASPNALSPATAPLWLVRYQLPVLRSYVLSPETHREMAGNAAYIGGAFVDLPLDRAPLVKALLEHTEAARKDEIQFAATLAEYQIWLEGEAKGQTLEPLYATIPAELQGYVELVYDYFDHANVRLLEGMLYKSKLRRDLQSLRVASAGSDTERPFFQSTPRLVDPTKELELKAPFDDPRVELLVDLDRNPQPMSVLRELFGVRDETVLSSLVTEAAPRTPVVASDELRVRYFGHAALLIEWKGTTIFMDPSFGVAPRNAAQARYVPADIPDVIDYLVVTHAHHDHFVPEAMLRLRPRVRTLVVPNSGGSVTGDMSLKLMGKALGFKNVATLDVMESLEFPDGAITCGPFFGEHGDVWSGKATYVIRAGDQQMLVAADSVCLLPEAFRELAKHLGPIGTVFLGAESVGAPLSWQVGPLMPRKPQRKYDQTRRSHGSDTAAAMAMLEAVGASRLYIYAIGIEPWMTYLLSIHYDESTPQLKEALNMKRTALEHGYDADILRGCRELVIG